MSEQKIALVTGANKGIGFEVSRQLAARGFRVFLGARNEAAGQEAAQRIGGDAQFLMLDVSDEESIAAAVRVLTQLSGWLDVLVNNAGIVLDYDASLFDLKAETLEETLRTNLFGPLLVSQACVALLRKSDTPRIVNVSSGAGQLSGGLQSWAPAYSISKTALNSLTLQLAAAMPGVAVNSVSPGWVRTDMGGENAPLSVEEGADTIVWLASEAPQSLTGQFLRERQQIEW